MSEADFTQDELADSLNARLRLRGYEGTVSDRTVRHWLTGKTRWPHPRQREALEAVFGCPAEELGFARQAGRSNPTTEPEQPVRRRDFLLATTGTTAAVVAPFTSRPTMVGITDVARLRAGMDELVAADATRSGHEGTEQAALARAAQAIDLQERAASQRIRQRLFGVAADCMSGAALCAVNARHLDRAQQHLDRALFLAGMAHDPVAEVQVWNLYAMLARQRQHYTLAVDAAQAAQRTVIIRRDPFFASLAHARAALGHADIGDRQAALRSLGYAWEALDKAPGSDPRPSWITSFYGSAELYAMTSIVHDRIGEPAQAEAASHRALSGIPERFRRNRALATVRLALAQLHQGEVDQSCATADTVFGLMSGSAIPGRMRSLLGDFYRDLLILAPKAGVAREWGDRYRLEWTRA